MSLAGTNDIPTVYVKFLASTTCWAPMGKPVSSFVSVVTKLFAVAFQAVHGHGEVPANTKGTDLVVLALDAVCSELDVVALAVAAVVLDSDGDFVFAGTKLNPLIWSVPPRGAR